MDATISTFNDLLTGKINNAYASMHEFEKYNYSQDVFPTFYRTWQNTYDLVLQKFEHPLLLVQYEKLKNNFILEMGRILSFLGFDMTSEVKSCLLKDSIGNFKRKSRPQKEMDQIYMNFTDVQLNQVHETYMKYLNKFQKKINDMQIKQNLQSKCIKYDL